MFPTVPQSAELQLTLGTVFKSLHQGLYSKWVGKHET